MQGNMHMPFDLVAKNLTFSGSSVFGVAQEILAGVEECCVEEIVNIEVIINSYTHLIGADS